jgi:NAD(P)-dependent dehydrogenase (short-subunit alcohol dehydrogenase family)
MPQPTRFSDRLAGKVAIVTGAGAGEGEVGIGRATAYLLGGEGARLCCVDLEAGRAEETARSVRDRGGDAIALAGDVTDAADCASFVAAAVARFGGLDILVNNVGVSTPVQLDGFDEALWRRILDTNLTSAVLMSRFAVPEMIRAGGGAIVNISSIAGMRAHGALAYGPSKAAMAQLSREIVVLHGCDGIRANTVAPGHVMTPHAMRLLPAEMRETRRKVSPLGVEGDAWDVAHAVAFLASDEARFIAGIELPVDGGVTQIGPMAGHGFIQRG